MIGRVSVENSDIDTALISSLGTLPRPQKLLFIAHAKRWLECMRAAETERKGKWSPSEQHHAALRDVGLSSNALLASLHRAQDAGVPEPYLREAWLIAAVVNDLPNEPFPFPHLSMTLQCLRTAAWLWLPDPKPNHHPVVYSTASVVVQILASEFHSAFGKVPAAGDGSPFTKFCREALPRYSFAAPSTSKIRSVLTQAAAHAAEVRRLSRPVRKSAKRLR